MTISAFLLMSAMSITTYMTPDQVFDVEVSETKEAQVEMKTEPQIGEAEFMESGQQSTSKPVFYRSGAEITPSTQQAETHSQTEAESELEPEPQEEEQEPEHNVFDEQPATDPVQEEPLEEPTNPEPTLEAAPHASSGNWISVIFYGATGMILLGASGFGIWKLRAGAKT